MADRPPELASESAIEKSGPQRIVRVGALSAARTTTIRRRYVLRYARREGGSGGAE